MWMMPLHLHVNQKSDYDMMRLTDHLNITITVEAAQSVTFDLLNLELTFLFFKNTVK